MDEIIKIVDGLIVGLDRVEVHGQQNLALLYNAIDTLKNLKNSLENPVRSTDVIPLNRDQPSANEEQ